MKKQINISGLECLCCVSPGSDRLAYILYPMDILDDWIEKAVSKYKTSIVVITGMDWDNVFSPWPAPGQPPGSPDFKGQSKQFLDLLQNAVVPGVEKDLGIASDVERTLVGVSMSGLFALWQWMQCDTFHNIASLSGSFWYSGFLEWIESREMPHKTGKAFFLLGRQEPNSGVKAFDPVGVNTLQIVSMLKKAGIEVEFEWVPGNHFVDAIPRLNAAFSNLFS